MTSTGRSTRPPAQRSSRGERKQAAAERAAAARRAAQRRARQRWAVAGAAALAVAGGVVFLATRGDDAGDQATAAPVVGGDLHTLTAADDSLYVAGHAAAAVSRDGGTWEQIPSLKDADPMGWAQTGGGLLAGGHPGLFRSTDGGATFTQLTGASAVPDAHALGSAGDTVYLGSPEAGLMISEDGGGTWQTRNADAGRSFMGTILVDPSDPQRLLAPDMSQGLVASTDGGRTWTPLGGPKGAMAVAWDPTEVNRIVVAGMSDSAISTDGGQTWQPLPVPSGTSAVAFSVDGSTLYAGALDGEVAEVSASTDGGRTWDPR